MIAASYVFYGWWNWRYVFLLAAVSFITQIGGDRRRPPARPSAGRTSVALGVAATIAPLLFFKYYGFFTVNVDERRDHARAARSPRR